jgi:hypothetical protein
MATLTRVGSGAKQPVRSLGERPIQLGIYTFALDSSYASGGEDISAIWDDFKEVLAIFPASGDLPLADQRYYNLDFTGKKLIVYTAGATEATGDQSAVTNIKLLVVGYM